MDVVREPRGHGWMQILCPKSQNEVNVGKSSTAPYPVEGLGSKVKIVHLAEFLGFDKGAAPACCVLDVWSSNSPFAFFCSRLVQVIPLAHHGPRLGLKLELGLE